jgi:Na+-transporting NADH:ubiquinone oxidoreductase subunit A
MGTYRIKKGRDIRIKGAALKTIEDVPLPPQIAIQPDNFRGVEPRLQVKEGESVKVGSPLFHDKKNSAIVFVSPASGTVAAINRGEKRRLLEVVIACDGRQETLSFPPVRPEIIASLSRQEIISRLLVGGVWPCLRQRPFSKIAHPQEEPKAIFVQAMNTEPLALEVGVILEGKEKSFQVGLQILSKLTTGDVHLCYRAGETLTALTQATDVRCHTFAGPHPAGNVSTHIYHIDPIRKGEVVWYIRAEDVLRVAAIFTQGTFDPQRFVAVTGEGAPQRTYKKTIIGAPLKSLLGGPVAQGMRYISGSILTGTAVGAQGYLCFYDSQITVIPEGGKREFLGWLFPGLKKYTFTRMFASAGKSRWEASLDTDEHGSHRAIVMNDVYDKYMALDIPVYFLLKAVMVGELEEAERLGILECDEEDFALCTFACPSKVDVGGVIRKGLDLIEREG